MKFAITICATERYTYAMTAQARHVQASCAHIPTGHIILVGDDCASMGKIVELYKELMPKWNVERIILKNVCDKVKNYQQPAQLVIGKLRTAAFTRARTLGVDQCLSLDSDVLPPLMGVIAMQQMLEFSDNYYSISTCPYPSQGGGGFLGGRGSIYFHIAPDIYEDERVIPEEFLKGLNAVRDELRAMKQPTNAMEFKQLQDMQRRVHSLQESCKQFPPKGNVFDLNGKRWRPRGWMEFAYPALGRGSVVPSDWCGFGCTLLNKKALAVTQFDGYPLGGTEDLYIIWYRWFQEGMKINAILHTPADHVIRNPGKPNYYLVQQAYHETEGDAVGHLRIRTLPFYAFDDDEVFDPENDGIFVPPQMELPHQLQLNFTPKPVTLVVDGEQLEMDFKKPKEVCLDDKLKQILG